MVAAWQESGRSVELEVEDGMTSGQVGDGVAGGAHDYLGDGRGGGDVIDGVRSWGGSGFGGVVEVSVHRPQGAQLHDGSRDQRRRPGQGDGAGLFAAYEVLLEAVDLGRTPSAKPCCGQVWQFRGTAIHQLDGDAMSRQTRVEIGDDVGQLRASFQR